MYASWICMGPRVLSYIPILIFKIFETNVKVCETDHYSIFNTEHVYNKILNFFDKC